jgi:aminoglycoside phosphotransferase (APT) family kinase protein
MTEFLPTYLQPPGSPAADVSIDEELVRTLLQSQHPDLASLPIAPLENGFDNTMYRLGDEFVVRLPRRKAALQCLKNEQTWLPKLAASLPLPIPAPIRVGAPEGDYPWPWSILPWLEGQAADLSPLAASEAAPLAHFLRALHQPAPANAPTNAVRGIPIAVRAQNNEKRMARLADTTDAVTSQIRETWSEALAAPGETHPTWLHGDLHARNVLAKNGRITAIIDWGDITSGDRATDLASIWLLLDTPTARQEAIRCYGDADPALWARAKGWAIILGIVLLDSGLVDTPRHADIGRKALKRLSDDAATL